MQHSQRFRERLGAGEILLGASVTLSDPVVTDALADGADFIWIDLEHSAMSPEAWIGHLLAARAHATPALVRVPGSATPFLKPILDAGADGIIVPQVRSVDEVRQIVADCRYPPEGRRGFGPRAPSNHGRDSGVAYLQRANRSVFVAVQIENGEALAAVDDIVRVPGLDSVVLGPWDLSAAIGHPGDVEHPAVTEALRRIVDAGRRAGLPVGSGLGASPSYAAALAGWGVQWLQVGGDTAYLVSFVDRLLAETRALLPSADRGSPAPDSVVIGVAGNGPPPDREPV